jgi:hypothetical protein
VPPLDPSDRALRLLASHFEAAVMRAAIAEVRQSRVHLVKALPWPIVGRVRAGGTEAIATVDFLGLAGRLTGECSCGEATCVHVAATALLGFSAEADAGLEHEEAARQEVVGTWLAGLGHVAAPASAAIAPSERAVVYVLERDGAELALTVMQATRLRRGGLGAGSPIASLGDPARGAPGWVPVEDLRLIALLRAVTRVAPATTRLPLGRLDDALLRELTATGRLCWLDPRRAPLAWGPPEVRALGWCEVAEPPGYFRIGVDDGLVLAPARSCHYVDPGRGLIGPLDLGAPSELVARLISGPPVPAAMRTTVARSLGPMLRPGARDGGGGDGGELRAPLAVADDGGVALAAPLRPCLAVAVDDTRLERTGLRIVAQAAYGEIRFPLALWDADRPSIRDLIAEGRLQGRLATLLATLPHGKAGAASSLEFLANARHVALIVVPTLRAEGWEVTLADDFPVEAPLAEVAWRERLAPQRDRPSWFGLELGVVVAGRTIPLLPILLDAIRTGELSPTLDGGAAYTGGGVNLRLPDGELVHVPAERMARWLAPLVELQLGELSDDGALIIPGHLAVPLAQAVPELARSADLAAARAQLDGLLTLAPRQEGPGFVGALRPYQRLGVAWLCTLHAAGLGGLLADEMGLGKTVQLLAFLESIAAAADGPALVIAPRSMLGTWQREAARFTPGLRTLVHVGGERTTDGAALTSAALVITSYQTLVRDRALFAATRWRTVIFDEAQALKNPETQLRQVAAELRAVSRFAVTGTPLENHLGELWSLADLVVPGLLGRSASFGAVFRRAIEKLGNPERLALLRQRLAPFLLRRTKATVELELPPRTEVIEGVELEAAQRDLYESLRLRLDVKLEAALTSRGLQGASVMILDALLKLRQCCCDPRLVKGEEGDAEAAPSAPLRGTPAAQGERHPASGTALDLRAASGKLDRLLAMLEELVDNGRATLVFSQFTSMLTLIEQACKAAGIPTVTLSGQTRDRDRAIARFQDGEVPVFLISLKAGGVGLNLTRADTVIHYDPWWNPAAEAQATARAHRIGQTRPVMVYKLIARGTVEEGILAMQDDKRRLGDAALLDGGVTGLSVADLQALYRGA